MSVPVLSIIDYSIISHSINYPRPKKISSINLVKFTIITILMGVLVGLCLKVWVLAGDCTMVGLSHFLLFFRSTGSWSKSSS